MGLCKCPKRRVTNQFCFEHRVCVCENCMVTNHPIVSFSPCCAGRLLKILIINVLIFQCVVQSYLQWLQDSDYNSICELCSKDLNVEDSIRLTCYRKYTVFSLQKSLLINVCFRRCFPLVLFGSLFKAVAPHHSASGVYLSFMQKSSISSPEFNQSSCRCFEGKTCRS